MIKFEITLNNQNRFIQKCCMHKELSCFSKIKTKVIFPIIMLKFFPLENFSF